LLLAGGLTGASGKGGGAEAATGAGGAVTVSAKEYSFTPGQLTAPSGIVTITLDNVGTVKHTFAIEGNSSFKELQAEAGAKDSGKVKLRPGTYTFYCSDLGHRGSGMEGKLTVTGCPPPKVERGAATLRAEGEVLELAAMADPLWH